jgi:hypothetical protein
LKRGIRPAARELVILVIAAVGAVAGIVNLATGAVTIEETP